MEDEAHAELELHDGSTDEGEPGKSPYGFFPNAQHFVVTGGNFTNINRPALTVSSDFRRLLLGDLDLRAEICLDDRNSVVHRRERQASARRLYYARVRDVDSLMTVALYQGNNAEEEWREDIQRHSWLRHPNFVQIYGTASSSGIHAAVFHDDLVPAKKILEKHRESHLATVYLWVQLETDFGDARRYYTTFCADTDLKRLQVHGCTMWIRRSAGRLCVELRSSYDRNPITFRYLVESPLLGGVRTLSLFEPPDRSQIMKDISIQHYHDVCRLYLAQHHREVPINTSVRLGSLVYMPAGCEIPQEVACLSETQFMDLGWPGNGLGEVLGSGWTRVISSDIRHRVFMRKIVGFVYNEAWLAQANHIFDCAKIPSSDSDFGLINNVHYWLHLADQNDIHLSLQDLQGNSPSEFRYPAWPAYWSLDPSGAQRLGSEEAERLGFPSLTVRMTVDTRSWDDFVYAGIREFYRAKDFNPCSEDVARALGYPLYKLCVHKTEVLDEVQKYDGEMPSGAFCYFSRASWCVVQDFFWLCIQAFTEYQSRIKAPVTLTM
ncbi:hypothetical protein C8J57DRAFT_1730136 [Mycena rebaudengoi]|nr:hypothetical protein C8J57DRAFT_1730136 [Mycena rebaudengoi]